ncbi:hypothetical protein OR63_10885 [Clostridium tetani]|nr:hypothetical protein OR63_10885 [Clostridium tetani]
MEMKVTQRQLINKMLFCPKLTLKLDGEKASMSYMHTHMHRGWFMNSEPIKGLTVDIVKKLFQKYSDIEIIWSMRMY